MQKAEPIPLKRALNLAFLTFYGLGTILGAGIYVLVGKIAGIAGFYTPVAFLVAAAVAAVTAFSYAELASRLPKSAGEAVYVHEGFGIRSLSSAVGLLLVLAGVVSSATLANGFVGYFRVFFEVPGWLVITLLVAALGGLATWGIAESAVAATVATLVEISGLILIIVVSFGSLTTFPARLPELLPPFESTAWAGIAAGAFLAFYAFIGFEDMVNVAEEVKDPRRTLPRAIILAMAISTILYMLVATAAVLALPLTELASTHAPLALMFERATGKSPLLIAAISLFAVERRSGSDHYGSACAIWHERSRLAAALVRSRPRAPAHTAPRYRVRHHCRANTRPLAPAAYARQGDQLHDSHRICPDPWGAPSYQAPRAGAARRSHVSGVDPGSRMRADARYARLPDP